MATLNATAVSLLEWAKRLDPDGSVSAVAELLSQSNEILADIPFIEGNLPTGHQVSVRTGLPSVFWRLINQGVAPSKSTTAQITEACGMLEGWSEIDRDLAMLNGNTAAFRLSEDAPFLESMAQEFAQTLFYGNAGLAAEEFTGLSPRYSLSTAGNGSNVVKAGGSGSDNASIWLVGWGEKSVFGIFPKGSQAGLLHEDDGLTTIMGSTGLGATRFKAFVSHFQQKGGIALKDWRYVVRICNIDVSDLVANAGSQALLLNFMAKAYHRIPSFAGIKPVFYANRTVREFLDIQEKAAVSAGGGLTYENIDGKPVLTFRRIPIRTCDQLLETEATVA